jgi:hypothetical protein
MYEIIKNATPSNTPETLSRDPITLYELISVNKMSILLTLGVIITLGGITILMHASVPQLVADTLNKIVGNTNYAIETPNLTSIVSEVVEDQKETAPPRVVKWD